MHNKRPPRMDFAAVKRVPISAVLERLGVLSQLRRSGQALLGACPVHGGTNRRQFRVDLTKNLWFCFGDCARGGTAIDLVAAVHNVAVRDAAALIAEWFALYPMSEPASGATKQRRNKVSGSPTHKVFAVEDRGGSEEAEAWWTRIGSAFAHKDGKGLNIVLSALPVNGRIVLREFDAEEAKKEEDQKARRAKKT